ncbi:MAG: protoporphyrinogen oxidase HemJ [Pseudomonadota bacterium]|nr:protoporphyrinogen oxidase HemJ [Pseudomonadota bacterium]
MDLYSWIRALHVIAVISWMAGLLYLPRLFVYHAGARPGGEAAEAFGIMERRLLRIIMNPAMIVTWILGLSMILLQPEWLHQGWFHAKLFLVVVMSALHMAFASWRRAFAENRNIHSVRFYRIVNEVPAVLMVLIVFLVVLKPF